MKMYTNKSNNLSTQGQRFVAWVLFVVCLLGSGNLERARTAPGGDGAVVPAESPLTAQALATLLQNTTSEHSDGRQKALKALENLKDIAPECLPILLKATQNQNPLVRLAAVKALENLKNAPNPACLAALYQATKDEYKEVRLAAVQTLETWELTSASDLLKIVSALIKDQECWAKRLIAVKILELQPSLSLTFLKYLLQTIEDKELEVSEAAVQTLAATLDAAESDDLDTIPSLMPQVTATAMQQLLKRSPGLMNKRYTNNNYTLLHIAILAKNEAVATVLIDNASDLEIPDDHGRTPLLLAVQENLEGIAKRLLNEGVAVNTADERGYTPMHAAAENGQSGMASLMLRQCKQLNHIMIQAGYLRAYRK